MVTIGPGEGLQVDLQSSVAAQFGRQIKAVITETLEGLGIKDAHVEAVDKGALDCTSRRAASFSAMVTESSRSSIMLSGP